MLSILIPIYNQPVVKLVNTLVKQCHKAKIDFEILCFDDFSRPSIRSKNEIVNSTFGVNYVNLSENIGRSRIRNMLARTARFTNLLFLDCDSRIPNAKFILRYKEYLNKEQITYGGRNYVKKEPKSKKRKLHWRYGSTREALPAKKRNKNPYLDFMSNNFMIHKSIFEIVKFNDDVEGYGYEDTMIAEELKHKNVPIVHIDNPVIHMGIENNDVFLKKTKNSIKNLLILYKSNKIKSTRLIEFYDKLVFFKVDKMTYKYLKKNEKRLIDNLLSIDPSIRKFNLWKLKLFMDGLNYS